MATIKQLLVPNQPITITLANLADGSSAVSAAIDNSVNLYIGADIQCTFKTGAGVSGNGTLDFYLLRCLDGTGTAFDSQNSPTATLIDSFPATASTTSLTVSMGVELLPSRWQLMVVNNTGDNLDSTSANFTVIFEGKQLTVA